MTSILDACRALLFLVTIIAPPAFATEARIIDGDTIDVEGVRVRIFGMDTPEAAQTCLLGDRMVPYGQIATQALSDFLAGKSVECRFTGDTSYGRVVARCYAGGEDIAALMVRSGLAWAYRQYSGDEYVDEEDEARGARRGVWAAQCVPAWEWRRR